MSRTTRAAQKEATRAAIVDAAVACLMTSGYSSVRTRDVARAAGVAQGTVTYHFPSRQSLLSAAVTQMIEQQLAAARALTENLQPTELTLERALDHLWATFLTPEGLAAAHLWFAAWSEPDLIPTVRELEDTVFSATVQAFGGRSGRSGGRAGDRNMLTFLDLVLSVIRGLVQSIPIRGLAEVEARWKRSKLALLAVARANEPTRPNRQN